LINEFFKHVLGNDRGKAETLRILASDSLYGWDLSAAQDNDFQKRAFYRFDVMQWRPSSGLGIGEYESGTYLFTEKPQDLTLKTPEWEKDDNLGKALGAIVGSDYRRDHLTLLEAGLNVAKGRIFSKKSAVGKDRLKSLQLKNCVKNQDLAFKRAPKKNDVFQDRINLIKQVSFGVLIVERRRANMEVRWADRSCLEIFLSQRCVA
jgi:hypothetical protein